MKDATETARRLRAGEAVVAGVLSGTSADGVDVALCRFDASPEGEDVGAPRLLAFHTTPFPGDLAVRLRPLLDGGAVTLGGVALLDRDLGRAFGAAAAALARDSRLPLDVVGSHGQTVWHHDGAHAAGPATLQLGELDHVAHAAGALAVGDFRQADIAAGGEGAPLSALVDGRIFPDLPRPAGILNLGGMANLTLLPAPGGEVRSFDTGPANALLDGLAVRLLDRPLDQDGAAAAGGTAVPDLVARWLDHPFFAVAPPKSTGRDTFGAPWIDRLVAAAPDVPPADLLATGVEVVARSVAEAWARWGSPEAATPVAVAGGGVHHPVLLDALDRALPSGVISSARVGVDPDAREALVFATLAARALCGVPSTRSSATGARDGHVLGKICRGLPHPNRCPEP